MGIKIDEAWMRHAFCLAQRAEEQGEVPVGAVLVAEDKNLLLAEGWNQSIQLHDASAHAEIVAIRHAGIKVSNYRLVNTTLYVTLEPCVMCMGAISQARIKRLVFGAYDSKRGAVCHTVNLAEADFLNHRCDWLGGVLEQDCSELLIDFFRQRRKRK